MSKRKTGSPGAAASRPVSAQTGNIRPGATYGRDVTPQWGIHVLGVKLWSCSTSYASRELPGVPRPSRSPGVPGACLPQLPASPWCPGPGTAAAAAAHGHGPRRGCTPDPAGRVSVRVRVLARKGPPAGVGPPNPPHPVCPSAPPRRSKSGCRAIYLNFAHPFAFFACPPPVRSLKAWLFNNYESCNRASEKAAIHLPAPPPRARDAAK